MSTSSQQYQERTADFYRKCRAGAVQPGQVWSDNDPRAAGRLLLVITVPSLNVPDPGSAKVLVEVVRSRDAADGPEDARARGRTRHIQHRRFRATMSTGYTLTKLTAEDVS